MKIGQMTHRILISWTDRGHAAGIYMSGRDNVKSPVCALPAGLVDNIGSHMHSQPTNLFTRDPDLPKPLAAYKKRSFVSIAAPKSSLTAATAVSQKSWSFDAWLPGMDTNVPTRLNAAAKRRRIAAKKARRMAAKKARSMEARAEPAGRAEEASMADAMARTVTTMESAAAAQGRINAAMNAERREIRRNKKAAGLELKDVSKDGRVEQVTEQLCQLRPKC
ncbi:hypothetical protein EDC01DRAFT_629249 [Geopyxis carbonaria]|nr:hypothetical protein EDC01DRAFT_629249 [Geopyxis carbonaria]